MQDNNEESGKQNLSALLVFYLLNAGIIAYLKTA